MHSIPKTNEEQLTPKIETFSKCYVCGLDLDSQKIKEQHQGDNTPLKSYPTMTLFNGQKKELCGSCYKNHIQGIEIYQKNNPNWNYPK